jgi:CheY-like chemotaxis protein
VYAVILIAPVGAGGPLRGLMDRLASVGVTVTIVDELATAVEMSAHHEQPPAVMLDLRDAGAGEVEDVRKATEAVRRTLASLPHALPIVVTSDAGAPLIVACLRAGAGDIIDLALEGTATARSVVQRICQRQADRRRELAIAEEQRSMIEDLLKDLIRTERRSIDAEEALAARARSTTGELTPLAESRPPAVLLVEHERAVADDLAEKLEAAGVSTYAYVSGEEAIREAAAVAQRNGLDLALVAARLPGMDGLETVRRLRERIAGLPAFLMTSSHDEELAAEAADLGVLGFVQKPLSEVPQIVERLVELARGSLHRTRESLYLQRIKERHERVLSRYRSLSRAP